MSVAFPSTPDTLGEYALSVLDVAEDALASIDDAPGRAYLSASQPSYDCCGDDGALIVWNNGVFEAPTNPNVPVEATALRVVRGASLLATYEVIILRCAANPGFNGALPSPADMTAVAEQVYKDGWTVLNALRAAVRAGTLFERCLGVHFDGLFPINEQGGCVGRRIVMRANIPGIPDGAST